jgi:capsular exopolysaccharide synthesis family protein
VIPIEYRNNGASHAAESTPPDAGLVFDLRRFIWLRGPKMLAIALGVGLPAAVLCFLFIPVYYTASAEFRFLSQEPFVLDANEEDTPYDQFVGTQIGLMTGSTVLARVMDSQSVRDIPEIANAADPMVYLANRVNSRSDHRSELVTVTCSMREREAAKTALEAIVQEYLDYTMGEESSSGAARMEMLTNERALRTVELESQLRNIRELQASLEIPIVGETPLETGEARLYKEEFARAEEDVDTSRNALQAAETKLAAIKALASNASAGTPIYEYGVEDRVYADTRVSVLQAQVAELQATLAETEQTQQDTLPQRQKTKKEFASLKTHLATVMHQVRQEVLLSMRTMQEQELETLRLNLAEAEKRLTKYAALVESYNKGLSVTTDQFVQLEDLKAKAAESRRILEDIRSKIAAIAVESNAPARIRLASPVNVPGGGPDQTPRIMAVLLCLIVGAGLGLGFGIWRELADQRVRSISMLSRLTSLPVFTAVPAASEDLLPDDINLALVTDEAPLSSIADAYRSILAQVLNHETALARQRARAAIGSARAHAGQTFDLTNIQPNASDSGYYVFEGFHTMPPHETLPARRNPNAGRTLAVVSPTKGDGKSTLTCNLGISLARTGRRVLLVDLSYRRPTLEGLFNLPEQEGLVEVLKEEANAVDAIQPTHISGLYVLGPGLESGDLVGRLGSRDMSLFLEHAKDRFDHVILDTTPWLIMSDAKIITPLADSTLVVVGSETSTLGMAKRCLREIAEIDTDVVGVLLNQARSEAGGYMRKNQDIYYGYANGSHRNGHAPGKASAVRPDTHREPAETDL